MMHRKKEGEVAEIQGGTIEAATETV